MAVTPMKKIEILALLEDRKSVLERLQRRGVLEITDIEDERLSKVNVSSEIAGFERSLSVACAALEQIDTAAPEKKPLLSMLNGRKVLTTDDFAKKREYVNDILSVCYGINAAAKRLDEIKSERGRIFARRDILRPWSGLSIAENFRGTKKTVTRIGSLPDFEDERKLFGEFEDQPPTEIDIIYKDKGIIYAAFTCSAEDDAEIYAKLRDLSFTAFQPAGNMTVAQEKEQLEEKLRALDEEEKETKEKIVSLSEKREDIKFLCDYLTMRIDKYKALGELAQTKATVVISGYIPERYADKLRSEFENKYDIAISVSDPAEDEDVPVLLKNGRFSEPVEGITEMYALPGKRDVDPSPVMSFFYYLFFGMMLSDAGYGLVMLIATTWALKKTTVEGKLRKSLVMFRNCGISTLFWGALFGSWFGDLPQVIASNFFGVQIKTTALWFQPIDQPIKLLLFSFGLGILHLFLGLAVNFKILWKEGRKTDAVFNTIPVYLTILGVAPMAASILTSVPDVLINVGKYLALAGVVLIVLTSGRSAKNILLKFLGGIYGLYNTATGYLSDILSYSRLLALGLATGSIAGVINLIATMPDNKILKAVMLIVVGLIGHTANIAINMLGAYVHTDRLQFVELFSKFYEGGGRAFSPLKLNTKYIKFDKENIYE